jgi:hypothetical protein
LPTSEIRDGGDVLYAVITDGGTFYPHLRDAHPAHWAEACDRARQANRTVRQFIGGHPRKVNGAFMVSGEDVGDI